MKAIVFGGSGFIGSHVADELTNRGYAVKVYDLKNSPYLQKGQEMIIGDLLDEEKVKKAIRGCDYVYNFAGIADLDQAGTLPLETIRQNILGNTIVLKAAEEAKVKRFVYASTIYVYSALGGFYRCSKQAAETYIEEYQKAYGIEFTVLRYGTVYGPRSNEKNSVYRYLKQALEKGKIVCEATGEEMREYIHVRDLAKLSVDILNSDEFKNQYVNITGHHPIKFKEMLYTIKEMLDNKVDVVFKAPTKGNAHYSLTPYSFAPRIGKKLVSNHYTDLGQGLLELLEVLHKELKLDE
jgi:UDP-glucose 4-epimerase